jgi:hypothetical protein
VSKRAKEDTASGNKDEKRRIRKGREGKGREGKGREGKGREGKGREGKGREGKGREGKKGQRVHLEHGKEDPKSHQKWNEK